MNRRDLTWASTLMLIGVALGAFGAHGLRGRIPPEALDQWHTGVLYHFLHALALLALSALTPHLPGREAGTVRRLFLGGILLFSGSLYLLATREVTGLHAATPFLGPVTPLGGLLFMAGWGLLLITALRQPGNG
jgi:uncharacterized membrane protein YgdD (TMEM256/DUF423 family)